MNLKMSVVGLLALVASSLSVYADEDGSADRPYLIGAEADLSKISQYGMGADGAGKRFELTADITLTAKWPGIGTYAKTGPTDYFSGIFDGKGHKISNVVMTNAGTADGANNYRGFFNQIVGGTVKNLTVVTTGFGTSDLPTGEYGCAAIAGAAYDATIECCAAEGTISGTHNVGGIVVRIRDASLVACTNKATVTGSYTKVAGICVLNESSTTGCLIDGCVNEGAVTAANGTDAGRDGIAGIIAYVGDATLTISDCANKGTVEKGSGASSSAKIGQIIGYNYKGVKALEGTIKGGADVRMVGDVNGKAINRHLATVSGSVATFVADADIQNGKSYKSLVTGTVLIPNVGVAISVDPSLAPVDVVASVANTKVVKDGDRYYSVASVGRELDITDAVRMAGKGSTVLTNGQHAAEGSYTVANAFAKGNDNATRVLLKDQENTVQWTIADDFCPGEEIFVTSYVIRRTWCSATVTADDNKTSRQRAPIAFELEGSADGTTWKTLDKQSGLSWETNTSEMEKTFVVPPVNYGAYRHYRFRTLKTTRNEETSRCGFQYVALKGQIGSGGYHLDEAYGGNSYATRLDDFKLPFDWKIELDVAFTYLSGTEGLFSGCFSDDAKKLRLFYLNDNKDGKRWRFDYGTKVVYANATNVTAGARYKIVVDGPVVTVNGHEIANAGDRLTDVAKCGLALFATRGKASENVFNGASVNVYGVKVWDAAGSLQLDLRPGVMADGTRVLSDPHCLKGYEGCIQTERVRTDFRIHPSESDIVAEMRKANVEPTVTLGEATTLADLEGNDVTNLFSVGEGTGDQLLLVEPATTVNFDIPDGYSAGKPIVLTRFVIVPGAAKKDEDGLNVAAQRGPSRFELQASVDGKSWKSLYKQTEKLFAEAYLQGDAIALGNNQFGHVGVSFEIPEENRGNYRHYRLVTTDTNRGADDTVSCWGVQKLMLYGLVGGFDNPRYDPIEYVQNGTDEQNSNITSFKTGVQPENADMTIELKGEFTRVDQTMGLFCCRGASSASPWVCWLVNGKLRLDYNSSSDASSFAPTANVPYTITIARDKLYVNDTYVYSAKNSNGFKPGSEIVLMASHNNLGGWGNQACFKLKSCRIIDAYGGVVRDYVPVKNAADGKGCLYDIVTGGLLAANGTAARTGNAADVDFRQCGRAVTLVSELTDGRLPRGPLVFAFEGNQVAQGTLCAAFDRKFVGNDLTSWAKVVELGAVKGGKTTMSFDMPENSEDYRRVKFFVRDGFNSAVSHTRSYKTDDFGMAIIVR